MGEFRMLIEHQALTRLTASIVRAGGSEAAEAEMVADHLVGANLAGHDSHGVGMLPTYVEHLHSGLLKPNTPVCLEQDLGPILRFDGCDGYGQRVATEAMEAAIARCRELGAVVMALHGAHHVGRIGGYGEQAIAAGLVSIHFVNVTDHLPLVAPFRGAEARLVTNPICVAVPGTDRTPPTLLDMATSRVAMGKVRVAMNEGRRLAEGLILDRDGRPSCDPHDMFEEPRGALLPFGEHKGYGLALACELLGGILSGGGSIQPGNPRRGSILNNMLTILLDPARFGDPAAMAADYDGLIAYLKSSRPIDPAEPVLAAGDPERRTRAERLEGGIPLDARTWEEVLTAAASLGIARAELVEMA